MKGRTLSSPLQYTEALKGEWQMPSPYQFPLPLAENIDENRTMQNQSKVNMKLDTKILPGA